MVFRFVLLLVFAVGEILIARITFKSRWGMAGSIAMLIPSSPSSPELAITSTAGESHGFNVQFAGFFACKK